MYIYMSCVNEFSGLSEKKLNENRKSEAIASENVFLQFFIMIHIFIVSRDCPICIHVPFSIKVTNLFVPSIVKNRKFDLPFRGHEAQMHSLAIPGLKINKRWWRHNGDLGHQSLPLMEWYGQLSLSLFDDLGQIERVIGCLTWAFKLGIKIFWAQIKSWTLC